MNSPFLLGLFGNIAIALGIVSLVFIGDLVRRRTMTKVDNIVAYTVGLLLAIILLGFFPEIFIESHIAAYTISLYILVGMLLFYTLELFLHWHHCKDLGEYHHDHHTHEHKNNALMFTGTFVHNALHGIILFSAFSIDIGFGIATTLAVFLHAIPQNVANLLMNHKDARFAYIAAFGGVIGALFTLPFGDILTTYQFQILALISGGLLYTAMSDILPSFKEKGELYHKIWYLVWMILGVSSFMILHSLTEEIAHGHDDETLHIEENSEIH